MIQGSSNHDHPQFALPPQTSVIGPKDGGPAFQFGSCNSTNSGSLVMRDLSITGVTVAMKISNAYVMRFTNVGFYAQRSDGDLANEDCAPAWKPVNGTSCATTGCNVVLGSDNAALVIENAFWLWFDKCAFQFGTDYWSQDSNFCDGQRPAVILRGGGCGSAPKNQWGVSHQPNSVYLLRMRDCNFNGGGIQYQQVEVPDQTPAQIVLESIVLENSATPLVDLQSDPRLRSGEWNSDWGLKNLRVVDYRKDDAHECHWSPDRCISVPHANWSTEFPTTVPIISLNCSQPNCSLDGVSIEQSTNWGGPAVLVHAGSIDSLYLRNCHKATMPNPQAPGGWLAGPTAAVGVDTTHALGATVSDIGGGFALVGPESSNRNGLNVDARLVGSNTHHALLVGVSGDAHARLAIESTGDVLYGPGGERGFAGRCSFESMCRAANAPQWQVFEQHWDPPALPVGDHANVTVHVQGMVEGAVCHASHDAKHDAFLAITAIARTGAVRIFVKNEDDFILDLGPGTLRVACMLINQPNAATRESTPLTGDDVREIR